MNILLRSQITTGTQFYKPGFHETNLDLVLKYIIYRKYALDVHR
jgi:hypothetical protein